MDIENQELTKILLNQIKERDDLIKNLADNMTKLSDAYIIKDKEKDKRHTHTMIGVLLIMAFIVCFFIGSYFWSSYNPTMAITGDGNSTSSIIGNNDTNNQNKGGN
jgi:hypothetical protein